ncbi:MAG: DUF1214 domain-containing protein [Bacteroidales bacterium]|jgi:hypothetical protein|nr:DUF1214 domain-containing protein [Bacteroidales bacterium]
MIAYGIILIFFIIGTGISIRYFGNLLDFLIENVSGNGIKNGPWKTHPGVGRKQTSRIEKAAIARIGLGANDSEETIYWNASVDNDGNDLRSENEYNIIFRSKPSVKYNEKGFWSITIYGNDKFLVPNPYNKYMLRHDENSKPGEDFQYSIFLSGNKPENPANWIPLPEDDERFSIAFRCYVPDDEMKTNAINNKLPSIIKV